MKIERDKILHAARLCAHAALVILAGPIWLVSVLVFLASAGLVVLADWLYPGAEWGNCWSYAMPSLLKHGGYLVIRRVHGVKFLGVPIYHAMWLRSWPDNADVRQTVPLKRKWARWFAWFTFYFKFRVIDVERPHRARDSSE